MKYVYGQRVVLTPKYFIDYNYNRDHWHNCFGETLDAVYEDINYEEHELTPTRKSYIHKVRVLLPDDRSFYWNCCDKSVRPSVLNKQCLSSMLVSKYKEA